MMYFIMKTYYWTIKSSAKIFKLSLFFFRWRSLHYRDDWAAFTCTLFPHMSNEWWQQKLCKVLVETMGQRFLIYLHPFPQSCLPTKAQLELRDKLEKKSRTGVLKLAVDDWQKLFFACSVHQLKIWNFWRGQIFTKKPIHINCCLACFSNFWKISQEA